MYGKGDSQELPSLLEIKSILINQVDNLPVGMIGRIKIILNKVLYNINHVDENNLEEQLLYLKQLMMMWKIITQKRVRSNSTYSGYTKRSDMDYTLNLIERGEWSKAWNNMLINKITRNITNIAALSRFNELFYNIRDRQGKYNYDNDPDDIDLSDNNQESKQEEDEKQEQYVTRQQTPSPAVVHDTTQNQLHTHNIHMHHHHVHQQPPQNPKQERFNKQRSQYLATQGKYKKAIDALESDGLCPNTTSYRKLFKSKLEPAKGTITQPQIHTNNINIFNFENKQITNVARSMDHTAGAGVDGMKIKYLKQLLHNKSDIPELLDNITRFMTNMANGQLPVVVADHIRHSRAISGKKIKKIYNNDQPIRYDDIHDRYFENDYLIKIDIRPITIQLGWIRLCNRIIFNCNKHLAKKLCLDKQVGIGCPSGAQALIAAAKIGIDIIKKDPRKAMMKLDFRNCYNTIDRQKMLNVITRLAPELSGLYYQRYNKPYNLVHIDGTMDSFENGLAQGCNLSTAALGAIQKDAEPRIIQNCKQIKSDWKLDISGKYHDDATDVGNIDDLQLYFQEATKIYQEYGMEFKTLKSELIINRNVNINDLPKAFQQFVISVEQVNILGVPIGDDEYIDKHVILKHNTYF